jgi:hypothetical protein
MTQWAAMVMRKMYVNATQPSLAEFPLAALGSFV